MKNIVTCVSLCCLFGGASLARDISPEISGDLEMVMGYTSAELVRETSREYGEAFKPDVFMGEYGAVLKRAQEVERPEAFACPAAAALAGSFIHRFDGDYNPDRVIANTEALLKRTDWETRKFERERMRVYERLVKQYRPICLERERQKETLLLRANAARNGVTTLPNGIQYEVEAGNDTLSEITRGTREIGIRYFSRVTDDMDFEDLPDCVKEVADRLPKGRSWVFYIPREVLQAGDESARKADEARKEEREEKLRSLLGVREVTLANQEVSPSDDENSDDEDARDEEGRYQLLRLKVWKDDPQNPVKVLPDVQESVI